MAFSFGNMMKAAGHNFMQNARGGGGSAPILNTEGADISAAFGPQGGGGGGGGGLSGKLTGLAQLFGGGGQGGEDKFVDPANSGLEAILASLAQGGGQALAGGGLPQRSGYRADPNQPALPGRRAFGFRSS